MKRPIDIFDANIANTEALHLSYLFLQDKKVTAIDICELLRAELVLIVGAMDCYLHDVVCNHMHEIITNPNSTSEQLPHNLANYKMPMESFKDLYDAQTQEAKEALLLKYLRQTLHKYSFESEQTINYAMSYIGVKHFWVPVANRMHSDTEKIQKQLAIIVHRRNVIAHQADIADYVKTEKQEISPNDVNEVKKFIVNFTHALDVEILQKTTGDKEKNTIKNNK